MDAEAPLRLEWTREAFSEATLIGRVLDPAGDPLCNASVRGPGGTLLTDESGSFRFPPVGSRRRALNLTASCPGFIPQRKELEIVEGVELFEEEFVLGRAAPIHGVIVDSAGSPVSGVSLRPTGDTDVPPGTRFSDPAGRFHLDGLGAGEWDVRVTLPPTIGGLAGTGQTFRLRAPDPAAELVVEREVVPSGRLIAHLVDSSTTRAVTPSSARIHPADEEARTSGLSPRARWIAGTVYGRRIPTGRWNVVIDVDGHHRLESEFQVSAAEPLAELDLDATPRGPGRIEGRVIALGLVDPLEGVLDFSRPSAGKGVAGGADYFTSVDIGADGKFVVEGVEPGRIQAEFAGSKRMAEISLEVLPGQTTELEIHAEIAAELHFVANELPPPCRVYISHAPIGEQWKWRWQVPRSDLDVDWMRFSVSPGSYRWKVSFDGGEDGTPQDQEGTVEVGLGETAVIRVPIVREGD